MIHRAKLLVAALSIGLEFATHMVSAAPPDAESVVDAKLKPVGEGPLWTSPTSGQPLDLKYLPQGIEAVVAMRPASFLKHPESKKFFDPEGRVLGHLGEMFSRDLPALAGCQAEDIDQVLLAIMEGTTHPSKFGVVVRYVKPQSEQALVAAWNNPPLTEFRDSKEVVHRTYRLAGLTFYLPPAEEGKVLVVIPPLPPAELAVQIGLLMVGKSHAVRPELQTLLHSSDADRHFTLVCRPGYLLARQTEFFTGVAARLREPLLEFLSFDNTASTSRLSHAAMLSFHLSDHFFTELRLADRPQSTEADPFAARPSTQVIAERLQTRVKGLPRQIKILLFGLHLTPYSKGQLIDFDTMLGSFADYTRIAADDEQVVSRTYLPAGAAQHLALSTYLCLQESHVAASTPMVVQSRTAQNLQKRTSLEFGRNTLEDALRLLSERLDVTIEIMGTDLQIEGITKNQSFGLSEVNKTGEEILKSIFKKTNPKLVYFIQIKPETGQEVIYIGTRGGLVRRKMKAIPDDQVDATPPMTPPAPQTAGSLDEKLAAKISLVFDRNPLEVTMQLLSKALGIEIQILGGDLQLDGITKNQSSGMNETNKPGKEILLGFLGRAHPKLVYFTKLKEGNSGEEVIYISSQSGVTKRLEQKEQIKLPPEFAPRFLRTPPDKNPFGS